MNYPAPIANNPHLLAIAKSISDELATIPVESVMTFMMQVLESTAIPTMATDLGVNGVGGLAVANTEQERRDILFNAIKTKMKLGTIGALQDAVVTLGYSEPIIIEGAADAPVTYNGGNNYNGIIQYQGGNGGWATFVVVLPEAELISLTQTQIDLLVRYVNHWKRACTKLIGIGYFDTVDPDYSGLFNFDGTIDYDAIPAQTVIFVT
tara:strand:+ start:2430 stop:3053 length:624 start_codon:yes stop_codon:yes gene_type:complete